jgi:GT2 family glycosyltransferase
VAAATGDILAFTDDDCYVETDWLIQLEQVFTDDTITYCGGRVVLHDPTDAPMTIRTATRAELFPGQTFIGAGWVIGSNMAVRRSACWAVGGFDSDLGPGTPFNCEDVDFIARLSLSGCKGGYFPGPTVRHHHGRKPGKAAERVRRSYDRGRGAYYAKFLLIGPARGLYLRHRYWMLSAQFRQKEYRAIFRECVGAFRYVLHRLARVCGRGYGAPSRLPA